MNAVQAFVKRNALVVFVILSYLLSWWPAPFAAGSLLPHGPLLAALLVVGLSDGKAGIKAWWSRVVQRRTAWPWYILAVAIPTMISFLAAGLNVLLGAQLPAQIDWTVPLRVLPELFLLGGLWEEPGWTGYALPRLFERYGPTASGLLIATLIMAVIRTVWHLPLMISGSIYRSDILLIIAVQIVIAWLFRATAVNGRGADTGGGSVLAVMLLHLVNNVVAGAFVHPWFTGADWVRQAWLLAALWSLVAAAVLLYWLKSRSALPVAA